MDFPGDLGSLGSALQGVDGIDMSDEAKVLALCGLSGAALGRYVSNGRSGGTAELVGAAAAVLIAYAVIRGTDGSAQA